jgi:hypothetical protein
MAYIPNRSAFVLIPEQPMLDWVRKISGDDVDMDILFGEAEVYLVPNFEEDDEMDAILETHWQKFFDVELKAWTPDITLWPQKRTYDLFLQWFKFTPFNGVHDLGKEPIVLEKD